MRKNKLNMNREFYITVFNELAAGISYPDLAEKLDIPVTKAFPAFARVEETVMHSPKMYLECIVYQKANNRELAKDIIQILNENGYCTVSSLKPLTELSFRQVKKQIETMTSNPQAQYIIFAVIKFVKGA